MDRLLSEPSPDLTTLPMEDLHLSDVDGSRRARGRASRFLLLPFRRADGTQRLPPPDRGGATSRQGLERVGAAVKDPQRSLALGVERVRFDGSRGDEPFPPQPGRPPTVWVHVSVPSAFKWKPCNSPAPLRRRRGSWPGWRWLNRPVRRQSMLRPLVAVSAFRRR